MEVRVLGNFITFGERYYKKSKDQPEDFPHNSYNKSYQPGELNNNYKLYEGFNRTSQETSRLDDFEEELCTFDNTVIWSRGNILYKTFTYEEPVVQALFVWFKVAKSYHSYYLEKRSDTYHKKPLQTERQRALFVLLENYAKVYFLDGQHFLIRVPSHVRCAWAMNIGVILQRDSEDEYSLNISNFTAGPFPVLYSILDPLENIKPISIVDKIICEGEKVKILGTTRPFSDNEEVVIFVNDRDDQGNNLIIVTLSRKTLRHSVYRYAIKKENSLKMLERICSSPIKTSNRRSSNVRSDNSLQNKERRISIGLDDSFQGSEGRTSLQSVDRTLYATGVNSDDMYNDLRFKSDMKNDIYMELLWTEPVAKIGKFEDSIVFIAHDFDCHEILCIFTKSNQSFIALDIFAHSDGLKALFKFESKVIAASPISATRLNYNDILFVKEGIKQPIVELWIGHGETIPLNLDYDFEGLFDSARNLEETYYEKESFPLSTFHHQLIEKYLVTDKTISSLKPLNSNVCDLKDRVRHRVNFAFQNHTLLRVDLNFVPRSNLVRKCLEILSYALPVELYYNFKARYLCYQYTKDNDVKSASRRNEWENFVISLLSFFPFSVKSNEGIKAEEIEGWDFLLSSSHHTKFNFNSHLQCILPISDQLPTIDDDSIIKMCEKSRGTFFAKNQSDQRFLNFLPAILLSLHLVYQDLKLHTLTQKYVDDILPLLIQLSTFLDWKIYVEYYRINYGLDKKLSIKEDVLMSTTLNSDHPFFSPPDITQWILKCFRSNVDQIKPFPNPMDISRIFTIPIRENILVQNLDCCKRMRQICSIYTKLVREGENATIFEMVKFGFTSKDIESLPFGIVVPLCEAIRKCRENPPEDWPEDAYVLIGREDLAKLKFGTPIRYIHSRGSKTEPKPQSILQVIEPTISAPPQEIREEINASEISNREITDLRFGSDKRLNEVQLLLQSSNVVHITTDMSQIEESSPLVLDRVQNHCLNNFALPVGRGILTYHTTTPILTEPFPIPEASLTIKVLPFNSTIQVDRTLRMPDNIEWPEFHEGVASGLRIPSSCNIEGSWISLNKPNVADNSHAGFLLGLGFNGHLKAMSKWQAVDYLMKTPKHDMTTIALVLGLPASYIGTMDTEITRFVAVHVTALLPPKSNSLDVSPLVQSAALLGIGLLYMNTCNRYMAQVMLGEIGTKALKVSDNSETDFSEGYSLAAGLSLGFITLGQGDEAHELADLEMFKELRLYINGGRASMKKSSNTSSSGSGGRLNGNADGVNVNITSPGATIALGLLYLKSNKESVARAIPIPETEFFLDYVRPDFLLIRILARNLIMWSNIKSDQVWVESHVPEYMRKILEQKSRGPRNDDADPNLEAIKRSYYYIIAGACFSMALKYAGSADKAALQCLLHYLDFFMNLGISRAPTFDETITRFAIKTCLNVLTMCTSIVAAGTGNLQVLRRIRKLRRLDINPGNITTYFRSYGNYMVISMSLGFLFLGGGTYTLSTSNKAIAGLVCALFPRFPVECFDNRAHLQAFRHLWVLAAEPRCLVLRDLETREACYVPVKVTFKDFYNASITKESDDTKETVVETITLDLVAPCLLPESNFIQKIEIDSPRYWPIRLEFKKSDVMLEFWKNPTVFVKRKTGHLTYSEDPQGLWDISTHIFPRGKTLVKSKNSKAQKQKDLDFIKIFSSDPQVQAFTRYLCEISSTNVYDKGRELSTFSTEILSECLNGNKPEAIQIYLSLYQVQQSLEQISESNLWNLKIILEYYRARKRIKNNANEEDTDNTLIKREYLGGLRSRLDQFFETPLNNSKQANNTPVQTQQNFLHVLRTYLTNFEKHGGEENSKQSLHYLSSWLIYHEIPDRYTLKTIVAYSKDLKGILQNNILTSDDVVLQVLSTFWPYISFNTLKIIQDCCFTWNL
ncbi:12760_t:CDS:2 [Funneliformis mosseae]|uniref:12760_t:CDS:1 n=1 Tax=Funneliformis mosseae TaxID=27381 RepID=A0A9N8W9Q4_FUNMO|nr:12760_t:CDS:2 [Funneliformis mosseae]